MSYYIHSLPGRLRIKTPLVKENQEKASEVESLLNRQAGVTKTSVNPLTGSVVVNYDQKTVSERSIMNLLENTRYFEADKAQTIDQYINGVASKVGHLVWNAVLGSFKLNDGYTS